MIEETSKTMIENEEREPDKYYHTKLIGIRHLSKII